MEKKTFDTNTEEFLNAIKEGSQETYRPALYQFQQFLITRDDPCWRESKAPLQLFLDKVATDQELPPRQRTRITRTMLRSYRAYLEEQKFSAKSIHTYFNAIQGMAKYFEVEGVTTAYISMPKSKAETKSYPWDTEMFEKFILKLDDTMYQAIAALYWQSGLSVSDEQRILWGGIKEEFEKGICPICLDFTQEGRHKTGVEFRTFFGPETIELIKRFFKEEGTPSPDEKLFPVGDRAIQKYFAATARELLGPFEGHNPMGEHTIRAKFKTNMVNAGCPESYAEYFIAHDLGNDIRKKYNLMNNDQWRVEYNKVAPKATSFKLPPCKPS